VPRVGQRDYTTELAAITSGVEDLTDDVAVIDDLVDDLINEAFHETHIWPEDTDDNVTLTAGGTDNTFGAWAELDLDDDGDTLSSKFATAAGHISAVVILDLNTEDVEYILEIAYGDDKTNIARQIFMSGDTKKLSGVFYQRIRPPGIPAGEKVYYRMKCETALATCLLSTRYHYG